jgi:hypothetical protein
MEYEGTKRKSTLTIFLYINIALYMIRNNENHELKSIDNYRQHNDRLNEKTQLLIM